MKTRDLVGAIVLLTIPTLAQAAEASVAGSDRAAPKRKTLAPAAFIGRWRSGEGPYMWIEHRGDVFKIVNSEDGEKQGTYSGVLTPEGLKFRRRGVMVTVRPSVGDAIELSALAGKKDCLKVSRDEGYCRY